MAISCRTQGHPQKEWVTSPWLPPNLTLILWITLKYKSPLEREKGGRTNIISWLHPKALEPQCCARPQWKLKTDYPLWHLWHDVLQSRLSSATPASPLHSTPPRPPIYNNTRVQRVRGEKDCARLHSILWVSHCACTVLLMGMCARLILWAPTADVYRVCVCV